MARSDRIRSVLSWIWAILPLATIGLGNAGVFLYAALRRRSWPLWLATAGYAAITIFALSVDPTGESTAADVSGLAITLSIVIGTAHALAIRRRVFFSGEPASANTAALVAARRRRDRRAEARELARRDPALARELRIGRPDLPRDYDDGGLIDVNGAPEDVLTRIPGVSAEQAKRIAAARAGQGAFGSAEEVSVFAELPVDLTDELAEYGVFLR